MKTEWHEKGECRLLLYYLFLRKIVQNSRKIITYAVDFGAVGHGIHDVLALSHC